MAKDQFGDFQTPLRLATQVHAALARRGVHPVSIFEPSCGVGSLLRAAAEAYPRAQLYGVEINPKHAAVTASAIPSASIRVADFFNEPWEDILGALAGPVLIVGNPPWVTNADLTGTGNLPKKVNFTGLSGLDALTGKANFDISEWLLIRLTEAALASGVPGHLAFLLKVAVARKFLAYVWSRKLKVDTIATYAINAKEHFGASVDACLLVFRFGAGRSTSCETHAAIDDEGPTAAFGYVAGQLVADPWSDVPRAIIEESRAQLLAAVSGAGEKT